MENAEVTRLPLPKSVTVPADTSQLSLTPAEMRALKDASGLRLDYLFTEADLDEKTQMLVWVQLRRQGYDATWDQAADVAPVQADEPVDPTNERR